jgi:hypothetical protein
MIILFIFVNVISYIITVGVKKNSYYLPDFFRSHFVENLMLILMRLFKIILGLNCLNYSYFIRIGFKKKKKILAFKIDFLHDFCIFFNF